MNRKPLWISSLCLFASTAHAASFPCARAQRPVEKLICGDARLNVADERMGLAYRSALVQAGLEGIGLLRADQVQWLAWVQEICLAPQPDSPAQQTGTKVVAACMLHLYDERTKLLRNAVVERDGKRFLLRAQYLALPETLTAEAPAVAYPGFATLQVIWQVAVSAAPEWVAWNAGVERAAYVAATLAQGKVAPSPRAPRWAPDLAEGNDTEITVRVRRVEHGRVTTALTLNAWRGAHPSETYSTLTWLLAEARPLAVHDVFAPGDAWNRMVAEACWNAIRKGESAKYLYSEANGPDSAPLQKVISDVGNWTLETDGLHISYPEYSVAPRLARALVGDTVIPWTALQPVLARSFVAP